MNRRVKIVEGAQSRGDGRTKSKNTAINRTSEQGDIPSVIDDDVGMPARRRAARMSDAILRQVPLDGFLQNLVRPPPHPRFHVVKLTKFIAIQIGMSNGGMPFSPQMS